MKERYMSIWFRHLVTDWFAIKQPGLRDTAFVLAALSRGRKVICASSEQAAAKGIAIGMTVADAKAMHPELNVLDDQPERGPKLLQALAEWCIRFTPVAAADQPDGIMLNISGCAHLWGGEKGYLKEIISRLRAAGYNARGAIADTPGVAWAVARYGTMTPLIETGITKDALLNLPPAAMRLEAGTLARMDQLGLYSIGSFINIPSNVLRRRFGKALVWRISQVLGYTREQLMGVQLSMPYQERLPCLEPIRTRTAIDIAVRQLLEKLCTRLEKDGKGLRTCMLSAYRVDNNLQQVQISTSRATRNFTHLYKLFELKLSQLAPALGFELLTLNAPVVETLLADQETLWNLAGNNDGVIIAELIDRLALKIGDRAITRYLPEEHHWPERSISKATTLQEQPANTWPEDILRPIHLLQDPELVEVTAPLPDYPPMNFRYRGELHTVRRADGPERIEQEWWLQHGEHRDYYTVEDTEGQRYWLFRLGHYSEDSRVQWFVHGYFA